MENILVTPDNEKQLNLLKSLFEEMKIKFRIEEPEFEGLSADLIKKVEEARKDKKEGKLIRVDRKNLWESI